MQPASKNAYYSVVSTLLLAAGFCVPQATAQSASSSASTSFQIKGVAPQVCQLPGQAAPSGAASNATYSSNMVTIESLIDNTTAFVKSSSLTLKFDKAMCNYEAYLSLSSQNSGMTSTDARQATAGEFLSKVDYTVTANWGSIRELILDTSQQRTAQLQTAGANSGTLTLTFATKDGDIPLVNGTYTDTIAVQIGAKL
ncbi:hypothetical protein Rvan_3182 [Rhodomicrobium vannielii ATCC 17100]|jgi:hypothetical protein|uniref:Spore coat protein U domain-containing protein n=1 Tax=Rhodomicrobium vannielii (strain ATCC 17100 / DSM 162 / LMG 4299 / NCIMB 10020 / ATH 3.1.1) TaxID=648757 RepID=E3I1K3_RHOVT|nr:hypothetical protein [Rhodomicrobium vannielii]ADP72378.1 hypothetical protein Rvan_3182 [Rhodomicrobium vannielii ATCC 17100]